MSDEKSQSSGAATMDAPSNVTPSNVTPSNVAPTNNAPKNILGPNTVEVTFLPEGRVVTFEHGQLPYKDHGKEQSFLDVAINAGIHLDHACGGNCACTTCHVWIKDGADCVTELEDDEADKLDGAADLQLNSRLGCQAAIKKPGRIVVEIPAWNRNYVSEEH